MEGALGMKKSKIYRKVAKLYISSLLKAASDDDLDVIFTLADDMNRAKEEEETNENTVRAHS